ncbi:MAG: ABC transporter substrate-binding protein [Spirochaetota bacterium]|nr:MAG: ABC transporter substrate-binding protein [Spirochaetota bacterium]
MRRMKLMLVVAVVLTLLMPGSMLFAKRHNVMVFGSSGDAVRLDPADVTDGESIQRMDNIFEGLVEYQRYTTEVKPALATSWEMSKDGKEIVFKLRRGVKFHDGTPFNADAVVFSFARQYDPNHPYNQYGEWAYWGYMFYDVDRMEKIDNYTVKLVLKRPNASIMTSLAMFTVNIVSPANAKKWGEDAFRNPVGTGPFKFVEWVKDDHITLVANEDYWRERPKLDQLIFKVIPDPSARLLALEVGEVQGIEYPNPADFKRIKANKNLVLRSEPGMNVGYMAMNSGYGYKDKNKNGKRDADEPLEKTPGYHEALTKVKVRKAIQHAIDKKAIVDHIYMGTASVAKNGMPPFMLGYNDAIEDFKYDPELSKRLLREAGYPNGFEVTLYVMPVSRPYMFDPPKIGEAIQGYLGAVGIKVNFYQVDWGTYLQETEAGKHQMCLLGWSGDNGDPDNFLNVLYGPNAANIGASGNYSFYSDREAQKHLDEALLTYDVNERAKHYKIVQEMLHEDAGWVYLAHSNQSLVFNKNVRGYVLHPTTRKFFREVWID